MGLVRTWKASKLARDTHRLEIALYEVSLQDTNKQAETDTKLGVNPVSARDNLNSIYSITTYPQPWKCY